MMVVEDTGGGSTGGGGGCVEATGCVPDGTDEAGPDPDGCVPSGWSVLNPLAYLGIVKCALQAAFVPSPGAVDGVKADGAALTGSVPFSYVADGVQWVQALSSPGTQCFTIDVDALGSPVKVLSTCSPGPFESWLMANRGLMTAAMYAGFLMPILWWAWRQYAPGATGTA